MILIFFCPNRDSLHGEQVHIHKLVLVGEPTINNPSVRELIDARQRDWQRKVVTYFSTCDHCLSRGAKPELLEYKDYFEWTCDEELEE